MAAKKGETEGRRRICAWNRHGTAAIGIENEPRLSGDVPDGEPERIIIGCPFLRPSPADDVNVIDRYGGWRWELWEEIIDWFRSRAGGE